MDDTTAEFEIVVAGTGPAGMLAALALDAAGFSVALVGPPANRADRRTTALMVPALDELDRLGLLERIAPDAAPLRVMRIVDGTRRLIRSPVVTFHAGEIGEPHFGLNVPNAILNGAVEDKIEATASIVRLVATVEEWELTDQAAQARLSDGRRVRAKLCVAADGRNSPARLAAGIRTSLRPYPQSALALTFEHARPHGHISTEFHTEAGPFTQVPLPGNRSSLVWVTTSHEAEETARLSLESLSLAVETRMASMLGKVTVAEGCQVYPLAASLPDRFAARRVALVGEAAHLFPPIGAQGLNLGIRDVQNLVEVAARNRDDPGAARATAAYDRARRPDIVARTGAVSLLNRSLLSDFLPMQVSRTAGLALLGTFAPLRGFFMREGLRPGSGFRTIASSAREKVRR
ncbi:MAG: UbiH/UbiF family hydroxylase [Rhizobiaceae bacterium]|nr:UbiH/UbiF family hydroxylase [Rhizobiaceae bacterium]